MRGKFVQQMCFAVLLLFCMQLLMQSMLQPNNCRGFCVETCDLGVVQLVHEVRALSAKSS